MKKIMISIVLLVVLLMGENTAKAWLEPEKKEPPKPWMVQIYEMSDGIYGSQTRIILIPITKFTLSFPTKKVVENPTIVEKLKKEETYIEKLSDFEQLIEGFFDWLIIQGIM